jgi:hypothetical protein
MTNDKRGGECRASPRTVTSPPPSGRAPSLKGSRGDEVYLLPPLTLYPSYRFGVLEALTALMHLRVDVSNSILQPLYLF